MAKVKSTCGVVLELTEDEAKTLYVLTSVVNAGEDGSPAFTAEKDKVDTIDLGDVYNIWEALGVAGVGDDE